LKIITLGKRGDGPSYARAAAFVLKPAVLPKIFSTFAERYAERPGGYTRIHKFGHRPGDGAPQALVELVDNPRDLRFEMTARSVGWELLRENLKFKHPRSLMINGIQETDTVLRREQSLGPNTEGLLKSKTRCNLQKVLKYRGKKAALELARKAEDYIVSAASLGVFTDFHYFFEGHSSCQAYVKTSDEHGGRRINLTMHLADEAKVCVLPATGVHRTQGEVAGASRNLLFYCSVM